MHQKWMLDRGVDPSFNDLLYVGEHLTSPAKLLYLVECKLANFRGKLENDEDVEAELRAQHLMYGLRSTVGSRQLTAHAHMRSLVHCPHHGFHPQGPAFAVEWLNRNSHHPTLGTICAFPNCEETRFCREARYNQPTRDSHWFLCLQGGHVEFFGHKVVVEVEEDRVLLKDDNRVTVAPIPLYLQEAQPAPQVFPSHQTQPLPEDVWTDYIIPFLGTDLSGLLGVSRFTFNLVVHTPLYCVTRHDVPIQSLCKLEQRNTNIFNEKICHLYRQYSNMYLGLSRVHRKIDSIKTRGMDIVNEFVRRASAWFAIDRREREESLIPYLRQQDFVLLKDYAIDVLEFDREEINVLPPRAFWEGTKHLKPRRREFTNVNVASPDGIAIEIIREAEDLREELCDVRNTISRTFRRLEATMLGGVHEMMESLRACPFFNKELDHELGGLHKDVEVVLSVEELGPIMSYFLGCAERGDSLAEGVGGALKKLRHTLSSKLVGLSERLMDGIVCVETPATFGNLKTYFSHLTGLRETGDICFRLATAGDNDDVTSGLMLHFTNPRWQGTSLLRWTGPVLSATTIRDEWPLRVNDRVDVCILWDSYMPMVIVFETTLSPTTYAALEYMNEDIQRTLRLHGQLTGKCGACGRPALKEPFIGSRCLNHLRNAFSGPSNWVTFCTA